MAYNSKGIKPYIKSHLELQMEITLIELAPSHYFFVLSICLAYINMFDENPAVTLRVIKETKCYGQQWLSGRVLDWKPRGRGFEPHRCHCVVVLEKDTFILA